MSSEGLKISIDPNKICPGCFSNSTVATENGKRFSILKPAHIPVCKAHNYISDDLHIEESSPNLYLFQNAGLPSKKLCFVNKTIVVSDQTLFMYIKMKWKTS